MGESFKDGIGRALGALWVAASLGVSGPAALDAVASDGMVDGPEGGDGERAAAAQALARLASDPRAAVRVGVAQAIGDLSSHDLGISESLARQLADDRSLEVRAATGAGLADLLARAPALDRLRVVAEWAISPVAAERGVLARALCRPLACPATDLAIRQLATDASPEVRRFAVVAAARHQREHPQAYLEVAALLANDPDHDVRAAAARLLRQLGPVREA
jgi:HEAT repeat protein